MPDRIAHFQNGQWMLMGDYIPPPPPSETMSWLDMLFYYGKWALAAALIYVVVSVLIRSTIRIVADYRRLVIFRLGKFKEVKGPGVVFLMPFVDRVQATVHLRTQALSLKAENTMTRDAVSVTIDAVVFWKVVDPKLAVLVVEQYWKAIEQIALTALREMIGSCTLAQLLSERQVVDAKLREAIEARVELWGLDVQSVDIKDVAIPENLEDAMSRQAQAERERDARITLAEAEVGIASKTAEAAKIYDSVPTALRLRQMALVYEMGKNGTTILIPTDIAGSVAGGAVALAGQVGAHA